MPSELVENQAVINKKQALHMNQIIEDYGSILDGDQLRALPMIGYGMTIKKVAEYLKIPAEKIRVWVQTDFNFRAAVEQFRTVAMTYQEMMLNQSAVFAWDRVMEYLTEEYTDSKDRQIQANIAQFVIGQLGLRTNRSEIKHEIEPQLHVTEDSAGLIAQKLHQLQGKSQDAVEGEYRITVDEKDKTTASLDSMKTAAAMDSFQGEDFDAEFKELDSTETSEYIMHPKTKYGEVMHNSDTKHFTCHVCGTSTRDLVVHIRTEHKLSPARYKKMYGLPHDTKFFIESPSPATLNEVEQYNKSLESG